jgi:hypothetical protein
LSYKGERDGNLSFAPYGGFLPIQAKTGSTVPDRPRRNASWAASRAPGQHDLSNAASSSTLPPILSIGTLDNVRAALWLSYRHLFPPHALAAQSPNGSLVISWSIQDEPDASYPYATPVVLRFEDALIDAMARSDARQRLCIAHKHEPTLREGMRGYDPFARFPNARVVTIG